MRPSMERANEQLDPREQLANTPPLQSTTPGLHPVSIHQIAPPKRTSNCSLLLIYRPRKDERLSWPSWLTCSGRFTLIVVTRRPQAERTGSVRRPKANCATQPTGFNRILLDCCRKKLQNLSHLNCGIKIRQIRIQLIIACEKYCKRRCTRHLSLM